MTLGTAQNAEALTAATFTNQSTFTSLNSGTWQRVWTTAAGTSTYFVDASGSSFKSVKISTTAGTTSQTTTGVLVGGGTTLSSETGSTTKTDTKITQALGGTDQLLRTGSTTFVTEFANGASGQLVGLQINSITVNLKKTGTPTGTAIIGVFDSSGNTVKQFGTVDCTTLTAGYVATTFTFTGAYHTIANGERIGVFFNGGSAGNECVVEYQNANVFDGTTNSIVSTGTGTQGSASFTSQTARELLFTVALINTAANANDGVLTTNWENAGYVVRAVQTDNTATTSLRSGSNTILAEKLTGTSAIGAVSVDRMCVLLSKSGTPTGTVTVGMYDSSGVLGNTFNTMDAGSLTTTQTTYCFTTASDFTTTTVRYIGVQFAGGSVGNTVDVGLVGSNAYDSTNSILSTFAGSWTDTSGSDLTFRLIDTEANDQESGAFLKWNAGSALATGGVKVYWTDATKIPSEIKLSTSTDDVSYTDRVTISPTQSVGYEWLELDASYTVQYVKLTVVTWGSANSMAITEMQRLPTTTFKSALSPVEVVSSINRVFYAQQVATTTAYVGIIDIDTGAIINSSTETLDNAVGAVDGNSIISLTTTKNKIWALFETATAANQRMFTDDRAFTGTLNSVGLASSGSSPLAFALGVDTNGAAYAQDQVISMVLRTGGGSVSAMDVWTSAGKTLVTSQAGTTLNNGVVEIVNLQDHMIIRILQGNGIDSYIWDYAKSTNTATLLTNTFVTPINRNTQPFNFDGTTFTFKSPFTAYWTNGTQHIDWDASATMTTPSFALIETAVTGTLTALNDSPFYFVSQGLVVSGSGTTWTPRVITSSATIAPTAMEEMLNVPLVEDTTLFGQSVIRLDCDYTYTLLNATQHIVGSDADCNNWRIVADDGDTIGRMLTYDRDGVVVHASPLTSYTITLSAADPSVYRMESIYDSEVVDSGNFDSSGNLGQRYLYGQCYTVQVIETATGNTLQTGNICADNIEVKPVSLLGITIPDNWLGDTWSDTVARYCNNETGMWNATNNNVIFAFQRNVVPYNASVHVYDNFYGTPDLEQIYNFTNVSGISVINMTGINSNQTLYFEIFDPSYTNGTIVVNDVSGACSYADQQIFDPDSFGLLFGVPAIVIVPILTAVTFPKSLAYFGTIVTVAVIGIAQFWGYIQLPIWFWAICTPFIALAILVGYKRG